jgi:hypothetical protein
MPCAACGRRRGGVNFSAETMTLNQPQTTIWGPALWFILHTAAERVGRNSLAPLQIDEVRELELFVRNFPQSLPCPTCQKHSSEYLHAYPINWSKLRGEAGTPIIRRWFFDFHNHVNGVKNPSSPLFSYENIEPKYSIITNISEQTEIVFEQLQLAIGHNWVKHESAQRFRRHLLSLRGFLGI